MPQIIDTDATLIVHAAPAGRMAKSHVPGYRDPAFHPASSGVPLQMYGSHSGSRPCRNSSPDRTRSG